MQALFAGLSPATNRVPVDPQILSGTSSGGYNAAFLAAQGGSNAAQDAFNLAETWRTQLAGDAAGCSNGVARYRLDPFTLFNPVCFFQDPAEMIRDAGDDFAFLTMNFAERLRIFANSSGTIQERLVRMIDLSSLLVENLGDLIPRTIALQNICSSPRVLRIAVTNWSSGSVMIFSNNDFASPDASMYLQASTAIPGVFPPVEIAGKFYVDGGVLMNTPLRPALDAGAATLHVIYMDPNLSNVPIQRLTNTFDTMDRIWAVQNAETLNTDIENAARINRGVELLNITAESSGSTDDLKKAIRFLGQTARAAEKRSSEDAGTAAALLERYRQVTIHRYHPKDDLGGLLGLLRFDRPTIEALIQRGYQDAIAHDCQTEGCVLPSGEVAWMPVEGRVGMNPAPMARS
jgi:predicted acylesterase/phospholipase RssA